MKLTAAAVDELMTKCLFSDDESMDNAIRVEGIINNYAFHPDRITLHANDIGSLLLQLPVNFRKDSGGGWSFLNACDDVDGVQWTGLHQQMERLFVLGIAAGKARWLLPREVWSKLPGGMPYVQVD